MDLTPAPLRTGIPLLRLLTIGGALLALPVVLFRYHCHGPATTLYRLSLTVERADPCAYYGSVFEPSHRGIAGDWPEGQTFLDHSAADGAPVQFQRRFPFVDGCWWESTEVLTPVAADRYAYVYQDRMVSCAAGATPGIPSTRSGFVTVTPVAR